MSDVREVNLAHQDVTVAVTTDLQRRRELRALRKPELIDYIVRVENSLADLSARIDAHWDD